MTKQDRTTLKSFFRNGALPTAEHYRDLIDSGVNQVEDGFSKTASDGMMLNSVGSSLRIMSLYQGLGAPEASWFLEHGKVAGNLHFRPGPGVLAELDDAPVDNPGNDPSAGLTLSGTGCVGIYTDAPEWRLDVQGVLRSHGRIGTPSPNITKIPADGAWHDITSDMTGCQAFEVMAGAGGELNHGRYSMLHAIAMNAYHPRNRLLNWFFGRRRIRHQTAMYGSYADRISLRWVATRERHHFRLQMRTHANFGSEKFIRYYLTRLWFDQRMQGSRTDHSRDQGVR